MHHANLIRICTFVADNVCEITNEDDSTTIPIMSGDLLNDIFQFTLSDLKNFNRTIVTSNELGGQNPNGIFTGCAGSVQRNKSDIVDRRIIVQLRMRVDLVINNGNC